MSKKLFLGVLVAAVLAFALAACSKESGVSASDDGVAQTMVTGNGSFTLMGKIGEDNAYAVYKMIDGPTLCYIVIDVLVAIPADSNAPAAIFCP